MFRWLFAHCWRMFCFSLSSNAIHCSIKHIDYLTPISIFILLISPLRLDCYSYWWMQKHPLAPKAHSFRRQECRCSIGTLLQLVNGSGDQDEESVALQILNTLSAVSIPIRKISEVVRDWVFYLICRKLKTYFLTFILDFDALGLI